MQLERDMVFARSLAIGLEAQALSATFAAADERADILASCKTQTWMPAAREGCPCLADKAIRDLQPNQRKCLIVAGKEDPAALQEHEAGMTRND